MYQRPHPLLTTCALGLLAACGSAAPPETAPHQVSSLPAEPGDEARPTAQAQDEAPTRPGLLHDLDEGDTLTYRVHRANGEELEVQMRIIRVVRRDRSAAVLLSPRGTVLSDTTPLYPHWVIGTEGGLYGLEEHVSLSEPGFVPLTADGGLVTEARSNVAWHVPPRWFQRAAGAFERDSVEGWMLAGHEDLVEGTVRGERCVRLEREEGNLRRRMLVCANLGMVQSSASGSTDQAPHTWRLVDLGGPRSPELQ